MSHHPEPTRKAKMENQDVSSSGRQGGYNVGMSILFGAAIGVAVGIATGNLPMWVGLGAALGLVLARPASCGMRACRRA